MKCYELLRVNFICVVVNMLENKIITAKTKKKWKNYESVTGGGRDASSMLNDWVFG